MIHHKEVDKFQGIIEYNLAKGLVALLFIIVLVFLAPKFGNLFSSIGHNLIVVGGDNSSQSHLARPVQSGVAQAFVAAFYAWLIHASSSQTALMLVFELFTLVGLVGLIRLAYLKHQSRKLLYEITESKSNLS